MPTNMTIDSQPAATQYRLITDERPWYRYSYNVGSPYDDWETALKAARAELDKSSTGAIIDVQWSTGDGYLVVRPSLEDAETYLDEMAARYNGTRPSRHYADLTHPGCRESSATVVVKEPPPVTDAHLMELQQEAGGAGDLETVYLVNCALDLPGPQPKMDPGDARAKLEAHIRDTRRRAAQG